MESQEIEQVLRSHIQEEFMADQPDSRLDLDTELIQEGVIDSLGIFNLVSFLMERFGIEVESEDVVIENFETLDAIKALVQSKLS